METLNENVNEEIVENLTEEESMGLDIEAAPTVLDEPYDIQKLLDVPQEAKTLYREKNWDLQFIRLYKPGEMGVIDLKNILKKESEGYLLVPRDEIPGLSQAMTGYFGKELSESTHGLYVVGDQCLAKIPLVKKRAKRELVNQKTRARSQAIINDLRKNAAMPSTSREEGWAVEREQPKARQDLIDVDV